MASADQISCRNLGRQSWASAPTPRGGTRGRHAGSSCPTEAMQVVRSKRGIGQGRRPPTACAHFSRDKHPEGWYAEGRLEIGRGLCCCGRWTILACCPNSFWRSALFTAPYFLPPWVLWGFPRFIIICMTSAICRYLEPLAANAGRMRFWRTVRWCSGNM